MVEIVKCNQGNSTAGWCNTVVGSNALGADEVHYSDYGYVVSAWSAYLFTVAFALASVVHIGLAVWRRHSWAIFTLAVGAAIEAIGWGGRIMSVMTQQLNENLGGFYSYDHNSFIIQVCCLVIAPTLFSAANYIILGKLITATGGLYCILTARSFAILFMFADFLCLCIQGAGGAWAGTAQDPEDSDNGAYVMTAGVILQLVVTVAFVGLLIDFVRRYTKNIPAQRQRHPLPPWGFLRRPFQADPGYNMQMSSSYSGLSTPAKAASVAEAPSHEMAPKKVKLAVAVLGITTLLIVIRSVYRSVELTDGWAGTVAVNQPLFLGMDALLMALLIWIYIVVHPSIFLPRTKL